MAGARTCFTQLAFQIAVMRHDSCDRWFTQMSAFGKNMCNLSEWVVRSAYLAYARDDIAGMLDLVAPDLEWTYYPSSDSAPQTCRGRGELESALQSRPSGQTKPELEEVIASGDEVIVVLQAADTRIYTVATVRDGRIASLRACRDRDEARVLAGISLAS